MTTQQKVFRGNPDSGGAKWPTSHGRTYESYESDEPDDEDSAYLAYLESIDPINMDQDDDNFMIVAVNKRA